MFAILANKVQYQELKNWRAFRKHEHLQNCVIGLGDLPVSRAESLVIGAKLRRKFNDVLKLPKLLPRVSKWFMLCCDVFIPDEVA